MMYGKSDSSFSMSGQNPVIMRIDGTSSFMTCSEHQHRGWKEASQCDFSNMSFQGVSFAGANLAGAKLDGSNFAGCDFCNAILTKVSAKTCNFEEADFAGAKLHNAEFYASNFEKARFCTISGAFESALIDRVNFERCNMSDAVFVRVLTNVSRSVELCAVNSSVFSGCDMSRCNLQGIDFRTCKFTDTKLCGTSLQRCNFEGVDLASANLIGADLSKVIYSDRSSFPDGFSLPSDVKNSDAVRRKSSRIRWLLIAGSLALSCVFTSMLVSTSKTSSSAPSDSHYTESNRDTGIPSLQENRINRGVVYEESQPETGNQSHADQRSGAERQNDSQHILTVSDTVSDTEYVSPLLSAQEEKQIEDAIPMPFETHTVTDDANKLYERHRYADAIASYERMIENDEKNPVPKSNLARLLATCPEDRFRDGTRAVKLSMEAFVQSNNSDWKLMCIAAAAYAETGDFTSATYWAYKARRSPLSNKTAVDEMLFQFRMRKPCRW